MIIHSITMPPKIEVLKAARTINFDVRDYEEGENKFGYLYTYNSVTISTLGLTYDNIISTIMNTLYPSDKVQALTANYNEARDDEELNEEKRKEYIDEYHAYQAKRKEIKTLAKEIMQEVTHGQV